MAKGTVLSSLHYGAQKENFVLKLGDTGFRPGADSLFFASPKKSKQKKGEPPTVALRAAKRHSRRSGSGANSAYASNMRPP
jgi:hypothetical protein